MNKTATQLNIYAIQSAWEVLSALIPLCPIHDEEGYNRMVDLVDFLADEVGDNEEHPLSGLLDLVASLVFTYEREHYAISAAEPEEALQFLINARGLAQENLSTIVSSSNLSAILAGKQKINFSLAGKLGRFFGVNPALFRSCGCAARYFSVTAK
jgi:HTH-type transcriptional regulator / antitoxin HigA